MTVPVEDHYKSLGYNNKNLPDNIETSVLAEREKRNDGALSKFSSSIAADLLELIENGSTFDHACKQVGIATSTFARWRVLIPWFKEQCAIAQKEQISNRIYKHQHDMEVLDVDSLDPKLAMAHLRRQEQAARLDLEIAKRRDPMTWGDKVQNLNVNANVSDAQFDFSKYANNIDMSPKPSPSDVVLEKEQ